MFEVFAQAVTEETGALAYLSRFGTQGLIILAMIYYLPHSYRMERDRREERAQVRAAVVTLLSGQVTQLAEARKESAQAYAMLAKALESLVDERRPSRARNPPTLHAGPEVRRADEA